LKEYSDIFKQAVETQLNSMEKKDTEKEFLTSAFNCRSEIKEILELPETISKQKWKTLYEKSKDEIALKKTLACSDYTPYDIIVDMCKPEPDERIIKQLLSRPLEVVELDACISVSNKKGLDLIEKRLGLINVYPDEKIFSQKNIELLGEYKVFNSFNGLHLEFISSPRSINFIISELKRVFDITKDENSPFHETLDVDKDIIPFVDHIIRNKNVPIETKFELIDYFGVDIISDITRIPEGFEEYAYEMCSYNCFDAAINHKEKKYIEHMQSVIQALFANDRMSVALEKDFVNKLKYHEYNSRIFSLSNMLFAAL
jgi:hypothetical protein